jgi:transposase
MAGRRLRLAWRASDTAEALHDAYRAEGDAEVRMRLHGLWLLRGGRRVREVAEAVGVHYRTVQRWVRWYEQGGLATVRGHRQGGSGQPPRLTASQQEQVAAEVATGRFRTAAEIGAWIGATFGVSYRPGGLYSLLARLRCAPKVPRPLHEKADLDAQDRFKKAFISGVKPRRRGLTRVGPPGEPGRSWRPSAAACRRP